MTKILKIREATAEDYAKRDVWTVGTFHRAATSANTDQDLRGYEDEVLETDANEKGEPEESPHG